MSDARRRDLGAHMIEGAVAGGAVTAGLGLWVFSRALALNTLSAAGGIGLGFGVLALYAGIGVFLGAIAAAVGGMARGGRGRGFVAGAWAAAALLGVWVLRGRLDVVASPHLHSLIGLAVIVPLAWMVGRVLRGRGWIGSGVAWTAAVVGTVLIGLAGAHRDTPRDPRALDALRASDVPAAPVVVIGLDGVEPEILDAMRAQGAVPTLDRLWSQGASARLASLEPTWSPPIWTTIFTGRLPVDHGITFFLSQGTYAIPGTQIEVSLPRIYGLQKAAGLVFEERILPVSSELRRATSVWEAAGLAGRTSVLANRLVSWPAQPLRGVELTNRLLLDEPGLPRLAFPDSLTSVALARVDAAPPHDDPALDAAPWLAIQLGRERALWTMAAENAAASQADLTVLYTHLIDSAQHRYLKYHWTDRFRFAPSPDNVERFGGAIEATYRAVDAMIAESLAILGPDVRVLVVSDHGVRANQRIVEDIPEPVGARRMPPAPVDEVSGVHGDAPDGVFCLFGPGVRPGELDAPIHVLEIAPLVLHLLGLPVAEDLERTSPLVRDPDMVSDVTPLRTVVSFEGLLPRKIRTQESAADDQILEQLRSLGYIE